MRLHLRGRSLALLAPFALAPAGLAGQSAVVGVSDMVVVESSEAYYALPDTTLSDVIVVVAGAAATTNASKRLTKC